MPPDDSQDYPRRFDEAVGKHKPRQEHAATHQARLKAVLKALEETYHAAASTGVSYRVSEIARAHGFGALCDFAVTDFSVSDFDEPEDLLTRYDESIDGELCCIWDEASGERLGLLLILQSYQLDEDYGPVPFAQFLRLADYKAP